MRSSIAVTTLLEYVYRLGVAVAIGFLFEYGLYSIAIGLGFFLLLDEIAGLKE